MTNPTLEDFNRRKLDLWTPKVVEVLPEHFRTEYPALINLLDSYYEWMDSSGNIDDSMRQILRAKDIDGVSLVFLDFLIREIGSNLSADTFRNPREMARLFPDFYRYKGSLFSAKLFFQALYGEDVEITYPKDNVFTVGESRIGPEFLERIQDGALWQTLSILIKSTRPISEWRDLYKLLVHPAGFYLGGQVLIESIYIIDDSVPCAIIDSGDPPPKGAEPVYPGALLPIYADTEPLMGIYTENDSSAFLNLDRRMTRFGDDSLSLFDSMYTSMEELVTANPKGYDDSLQGDYSESYGTEDEARTYPLAAGPLPTIMYASLYTDSSVAFDNLGDDVTVPFNKSFTDTRSWLDSAVNGFSIPDDTRYDSYYGVLTAGIHSADLKSMEVQIIRFDSTGAGVEVLPSIRTGSSQDVVVSTMYPITRKDKFAVYVEGYTSGASTIINDSNTFFSMVLFKRTPA